MDKQHSPRAGTGEFMAVVRAKASALAKATLPRLREHAAMVTKLQGTTGAAPKP